MSNCLKTIEQDLNHHYRVYMARKNRDSLPPEIVLPEYVFLVDQEDGETLIPQPHSRVIKILVENGKKCTTLHVPKLALETMIDYASIQLASIFGAFTPDHTIEFSSYHTATFPVASVPTTYQIGTYSVDGSLVGFQLATDGELILGVNRAQNHQSLMVAHVSCVTTECDALWLASIQNERCTQSAVFGTAQDHFTARPQAHIVSAFNALIPRTNYGDNPYSEVYI